MERIGTEMLKVGILQYSSFPFTLSVLLVKKRYGTCKFYVDYRQLNNLTIKDKYPMPLIDELIDELHDSKWFSKIDLRVGNHQIRTSNIDIP